MRGKAFILQGPPEALDENVSLGELRLNPTREEAQELSHIIRQIAAGHQKALATRIAKLRAEGIAFAIESLDGKSRFTGGAALLCDVADQIVAALKR